MDLILGHFDETNKFGYGVTCSQWQYYQIRSNIKQVYFYIFCNFATFQIVLAGLSGTVKAYPQFPSTSVLLPWHNYIGEWCSLLLLEEGCQLSGKHLPEKVALLPQMAGRKQHSVRLFKIDWARLKAWKNGLKTHDGPTKIYQKCWAKSPREFFYLLGTPATTAFGCDLQSSLRHLVLILITKSHQRFDSWSILSQTWDIWDATWAGKSGACAHQHSSTTSSSY